jgi:hypothetical protein
MESIIDRLKKIQSLAERGEDGEALTARAMLSNQLTKYGLTLDDLSNEEMEYYTFSFKTVDERTIMQQCVFNLLKVNHFKFWGYGKKMEMELTKWQYLELKPFIAFHVKQYRKELKQHLQALVMAYVSKHDLFSGIEQDSEEPREMTEDYKAIIRKARKIAESLDDATFRKQLEKSN